MTDKLTSSPGIQNQTHGYHSNTDVSATEPKKCGTDFCFSGIELLSKKPSDNLKHGGGI